MPLGRPARRIRPIGAPAARWSRSAPAPAGGSSPAAIVPSHVGLMRTSSSEKSLMAFGSIPAPRPKAKPMAIATAHNSKRLPGDTTSNTVAVAIASPGGSSHSNRLAAVSQSSWRIDHRASAARSTAARWARRKMVFIGELRNHSSRSSGPTQRTSALLAQALPVNASGAACRRCRWERNRRRG